MCSLIIHFKKNHHRLPPRQHAGGDEHFVHALTSKGAQPTHKKKVDEILSKLIPGIRIILPNLKISEGRNFYRVK